MPLFDVPWALTGDPVSETPNPKKRKQNPNVEMGANIDKFLAKAKKAKSAPSDNDSRHSTTIFSRKRKNKEKTVTISRPKPLAPIEKGTSSIVERPKKKLKIRHDSPASPTSPVASPPKNAISPPSKERPKIDASAETLTPMQTAMKKSLDGARFRMINEQLYKMPSHEAWSLLKRDPEVFEEYHKGFRAQVESWPTNPIDIYISMLSKYPERTVIADLGCGDAALAQSLVPKRFTVLSFDLVSKSPFVIAADVCDTLPLPGSENQSDAQVVDVVVCSLSLMGTNWPNCIREARRILKSSGELKIAEVASRITNVKDFTSVISSIGFQFKSKDTSNTHFTLFEFKKTGTSMDLSKWDTLLSKADVLKPCEYKRR